MNANGAIQTVTSAEAGTVESVRLFNFMCHKSLLITLGPKINFIVGRNGSEWRMQESAPQDLFADPALKRLGGKSAVLTALTVCLGGTPRATGRATAVKDLLREGSK